MRAVSSESQKAKPIKVTTEFLTSQWKLKRKKPTLVTGPLMGKYSSLSLKASNGNETKGVEAEGYRDAGPLFRL